MKSPSVAPSGVAGLWTIDCENEDHGPMKRPLKRPRFSPQRIAVLVLLALLAFGISLLMSEVRRGALALPVGDRMALLVLVNVEVLVILALLFVLLRALITYAFERRHSLAGSNLKTRFLLSFLLLSILPSLLLFGVGSLLIHRSIDNYFAYRIQAPLKTKSRDLKPTLVEVERFLDRELVASRTRVKAALATVVAEPAPGSVEALRTLLPAWLNRFGVNEIVAIGANGAVVAQASVSSWFGRHRIRVGADRLAKARAGETVVWLVDTDHEWGAAGAVALHLATGEAVVVAAKALVAEEVAHARAGVEDALSSIGRVEKYRGLVKGTYLLNLAVATLLVLVAAVWLAFYLARRITDPVLHLTEATERVADGDLDFRLTPLRGGEIGRLVRSFSRMVEDLKRSRAATDRAHAELAASLRVLQERNELIGTILASIGSGVVSLDGEGRVLTVNPVAREMLDLAEGDEGVGRSYDDLFGSEAVVEVVAPVVAGREGRRHGYATFDRAGSERRLRVTARALHDETGAVVGTVVALHDYTELVRAQKMAAWREVARRIAHEIKNPLTPIRLATQRLRRKLARGDDDFTEAFDEASRIILEEVTGLERLVSEFSDFSRMAEAQIAPADLHRTLEDALGLVELGDAVSVRKVFDPKMPEVRVDAAQLRRCFVNLLKNAVEAMEGDGEITITSRYDATAEVFTVSIADTGPGIDPKRRDEIFLPYYTTKVSGTGLGLAIVKHVVADHRGYLRVRDNTPHGAIFEIELPVHE